jgi:hypothetical protein
MAAAADPAKTARFRDCFAGIACNAFAITSPIFLSGCEADCAPQHTSNENLANRRRFQDDAHDAQFEKSFEAALRRIAPWREVCSTRRWEGSRSDLSV